MLVQFKRNWFDPAGRQFRTQDGIADVPESYSFPDSAAYPGGATVPTRELLPKDARVVGDLPLPDASKPKLPGFGAKPMHEQVLDQIPGAAPLHQFTPAGQNLAPAEEPSEEDVEKGVKRAEKKADTVKKEKLDI